MRKSPGVIIITVALTIHQPRGISRSEAKAWIRGTDVRHSRTYSSGVCLGHPRTPAAEAWRSTKDSPFADQRRTKDQLSQQKFVSYAQK